MMTETGEFPAEGALVRAISPKILLNAVPVGIYCCDARGIIQQFNARAAEMWGRSPRVGETEERFCGAHKLFLPDGTYLPHDQTPMANVLRTGKAVRDKRVVVERLDGDRRVVLVNIDPLFDESGTLAGAVNCFQDITEEARSQEALQQSKEDLDDFFQNAAVGLHIVGRDGTILQANKAELEMLGYSEPEYVGRHITDFHADEEVIDDILARLSNGEQLRNYPARLRAKDGSIKNVLITSSPHFRDGEFVRTRCFTLDVTETKEAQERAAESEHRFRDVLEAIPGAVYTTDADGIITYINRGGIELAGHQPRIGKDRWCISWRLYLPDGTYLPHEECPMAIALREGRPVHGEELLLERPDGSRLRCMAYPTPLFDRHGRLAGAVNMLVDVTQRHNAEIESAHLAAIVSSSQDAIVSKSLDGMIQSWNAGAARIFGYQPEEMVGQHITRIIPPELHQEEEEILARLRRGERIEHFETERVTKDGRRLAISLTVSPVHDRFGKIVGASKVARDVSERKQAEELQRLLISELNHRVKNTLAMVQSIAKQTVRFSDNPASFAESFSGRIQALAGTHDLLTKNSWQGAEVLALVRDQVLPDGTEDERVWLSGPSLRLDPQPAVHLALVLHELGINARKYGALSVLRGRLSVTWRIDSGKEPTLHLQWQESGGPRVRVPEAKGFGSTLIERSLAAHGGEAIIDYRADGVRCDIKLPVSSNMGGAQSTFLNPLRNNASSEETKSQVAVRA